ncbi:unnamed protein product, partial [Urochloa humidicola]
WAFGVSSGYAGVNGPRSSEHQFVEQARRFRPGRSGGGSGEVKERRSVQATERRREQESSVRGRREKARQNR